MQTKLIAIIQDDGSVVKMPATAEDGVGIYDGEYKFYPGGLDADGNLYADTVNTDDTLQPLGPGEAVPGFKLGVNYIDKLWNYRYVLYARSMGKKPQQAYDDQIKDGTHNLGFMRFINDMIYQCHKEHPEYFIDNVHYPFNRAGFDAWLEQKIRAAEK